MSSQVEQLLRQDLVAYLIKGSTFLTNIIAVIWSATVFVHGPVFCRFQQLQTKSYWAGPNSLFLDRKHNIRRIEFCFKNRIENWALQNGVPAVYIYLTIFSDTGVTILNE